MKAKDTTGKKILGNSMRAGFIVIVLAIVILEATSLIQYYYSQQGIKKEASLRAQSELRSAKNEIMNTINQAESAVRNSLWIAEWCLENPDSLARVPQRVVSENSLVVGSTIALVPEYNKQRPLYAPYVTRDMASGEIRTLSLIKPMEQQEGYWSEPYFDEGGGNVLMTTFSLPVKDRNGKIGAILTADISLEWLSKLMGDIKVYPNAFNTVLSRSGKIMVCPADTNALVNMNAAMLSRQTGEMEMRYNGEKSHIYFETVERTGWSLSIVVPERDMFAGVRKVGGIVLILQILGVIMIIIILRVVVRHQMKYNKLNAQKELIQNELHIGHDIQMSMIPKTFPPFPDRNDIDFSASLIPAKEVGGDLYDFYIRDEKLFFCIGDVSGKGVPAALVMTVTQSLFRAISSNETSPAKIVAMMNDSMAENNDNNMFVTFFCGVLDLASGMLHYCNAGHTPPMLNASRLPVDPNIPLGVAQNTVFSEQKVQLSFDDSLFLYTDGLTEAENSTAEQFGEERMEAVLSIKREAKVLLDTMQQTVDRFVGDAPQSDDLTMLVIHYLAHPATEQQERHLILHNDIQQIPQLADFVETIASEKNLSQNLAMSLNLALEEAVTNVILYAYPKGSDGLVDVEAILKEHSLEFIISDSGVPFDPTAAPQADISLDLDERPIGGLGIYLVRQLMDQVTYQRLNEKNVLSMTKNI